MEKPVGLMAEMASFGPRTYTKYLFEASFNYILTNLLADLSIFLIELLP